MNASYAASKTMSDLRSLAQSTQACSWAFVATAPVFCLVVAVTCTLVHAFGDCPLRSPAVLTLFFVTLAAMPGFLPEKGN